MLGLLLIYFIGKYFYRLADDYDKSKWGFAILGIVTYYAGTFIAGVFMGIFLLDTIQNMDPILLNLLSLPIGIIFCAILYYILDRNWKKKRDIDPTTIEQIGKE